MNTNVHQHTNIGNKPNILLIIGASIVLGAMFALFAESQGLVEANSIFTPKVISILTVGH